jgi:RHS repeat-associated protein
LQAAYNYSVGQLPLSQVQNGEIFYYHGDNLGSARFLTNEAGVVTDGYKYDAYGRVIESFGDTDNVYGYTGEPRDPLTGLVYLRERYLEPNDGRFISVDPFAGVLQDPTSQHDYLYAHANPVVNRDPSGNYSLTEFSAKEAMQKITESIDNAKKIYQGFEFEDKIYAMQNVLIAMSFGLEVFSAWLEDIGYGWTNRLSFAGDYAGFSGASKLSFGRVWKDNTLAPFLKQKGFKKLEFNVSLGLGIRTFEEQIELIKAHDNLDFLGPIGDINSISALGYFAMESTFQEGSNNLVNNALNKWLKQEGSSSGIKGKISFGVNPWFLGGSIGQDFPVWQDKQTTGKLLKLSFGVNGDAKAGFKPSKDQQDWKIEPAFSMGMFVQLALGGETIKLKWSPVFLKISQKKGLEFSLTPLYEQTNVEKKIFS